MVKKTKAFLITSNKNGLEVNVEITNHNIMTGNKSFKKVEQFRCLGATLTIQTSIHEEIECSPEVSP